MGFMIDHCQNCGTDYVYGTAHDLGTCSATLRAQLAEADAMLEAIGRAQRGESVSDFEASWPLVYHAREDRNRLDAICKTNRNLRAQLTTIEQIAQGLADAGRDCVGCSPHTDHAWEIRAMLDAIAKWDAHQQ